MANEITVSGSLEFSKGSNSAKLEFGGLSIDVSGTNYNEATQTVGTSEEALNLGDVNAAGLLIIQNQDATNYVELRPASGEADLVKLKAGEWAIFRLASSTPYAIANTASCVVKYLLIED